MPQFSVSAKVSLTTRVVAETQEEAELIAKDRPFENWAVSDLTSFIENRHVVMNSLSDGPIGNTACVFFEYSPNYWQESDYGRVEKIGVYIPLFIVNHFATPEYAFTYYTGYPRDNIISWIDENQALFTPDGKVIEERR